jgi:hypothetical protein
MLSRPTDARCELKIRPLAGRYVLPRSSRKALEKNEVFPIRQRNSPYGPQEELDENPKMRADYKLCSLCFVAVLTFADTKTQQPSLSSEVLGLQLSFEANRGQMDPSVKFIARGDGYTLFLSDEGAVFKLRGSLNTASGVLRMRLAGTNSSAEVSGGEALPGTANYFIGNDRSKWVQGVATYRKVNYRQAYEGIDLVYYGTERRMEYDFVVAPGANPKEIALEFSGARLSLGADGDLMAALAGNSVFGSRLSIR